MISFERSPFTEIRNKKWYGKVTVGIIHVNYDHDEDQVSRASK